MSILSKSGTISSIFPACARRKNSSVHSKRGSSQNDLFEETNGSSEVCFVGSLTLSTRRLGPVVLSVFSVFFMKALKDHVTLRQVEAAIDLGNDCPTDIDSKWLWICRAKAKIPAEAYGNGCRLAARTEVSSAKTRQSSWSSPWRSLAEESLAPRGIVRFNSNQKSKVGFLDG